MQDWLDRLKNSKKIVLVEGEKDKIALKKLGVKNAIAIARKPIFEFIEEIAEKNKEVIILTDLDDEGKKLYSKLKNGFQRYGIKVDNKFREELFRNTHISQIEGIFRHFSRHFSGSV